MNSYPHHESYSDAHFYLQGSFIKFRNTIARVLEISGEGVTWLSVNKDEIRIKYEDLDLSPIELGYVYSPSQNRTYYLERMPRRQWRQGLTPDNTRDRLGAYLEFNASSDYFIRSISKRFPSLLRAFKLANKTGVIMPFSKDYAISSLSNIYFKTIKVGKFNRESITFDIDPSYFFLEKELEEFIDVYKRFL